MRWREIVCASEGEALTLEFRIKVFLKCSVFSKKKRKENKRARPV